MIHISKQSLITLRKDATLAPFVCLFQNIFAAAIWNYDN